MPTEATSKAILHSGANPLAARQMHIWAKEADIPPSSITCSASAWCYASEEERKWWSEISADRPTKSDFTKSCLENGFATQEELDKIAADWRAWGKDENGWWMMPHGEILCRV